MAFFEDNLITAKGGITHLSEGLDGDEGLTSTMENTIFFVALIDTPRTALTSEANYGSELRNKSLASLKPEISQAVSSLLDEFRVIDDTRTMRTGSSCPRRQSFNHPDSSKRKPPRVCILCKTAGRAHTSHNLAASYRSMIDSLWLVPVS